MWFAIIIGLLIAGAIGVGVANWVRIRKRGNGVRRLAEHHSGSYTAMTNDVFPRIQELPFVREKGPEALSGRGDNLVRVDLDGWQVTAFELFTAKPRTKNDLWHNVAQMLTYQRRTIWIVELPEKRPTTELVPRAEAARATEVVTGDAQFDAEFTITTSDPAFVQAVLTPEMRGRLAEAGKPSWRLEGAERTLLAWQKGTVSEPEQLFTRARVLTELAARIQASPSRAE